MPAVLDDREFYTPDEVAELLGLHPDYLRRTYLSPNGDLPCYRISGTTIRVLGADLHAWLEARRDAPAPPPTPVPDEPRRRRRR